MGNNRKQPANRIEEVRKAKGWSLEQLAEAASTTKQQIWKLENGERKLSHAWMDRISKALGCQVVDILPAITNISSPVPRKVVHSQKQPLMEAVVIEELDIRAASGGGALKESEDGERVVAEWQMPGEFVRSHTSTPAERIKILPVTGDSNVPDFMPGDRVMVDTADRRPSPPGMFVLWDGIGLVMKRVEVIPNSQPISVRLISQNPLYQTYERPIADVHINGRVIGKWART